MTKSEQRQELIELRHKLIGVLHTQPHTIYNNETIEALLNAQPMSIEELTKVKGFPANGKRVKTFGKAVVAIFNPEFKESLAEEAKKEAAEQKPTLSVKETAKKLSYFALAAGILASNVANVAAMAHTVPVTESVFTIPVTASAFNGTATGSSIATSSSIGKTIDGLSETQKRDVAVQEFYQRTKDQSETDWNKVCEEVTTNKLKEEEEKKRRDEEKVRKATEKVTKLRKAAIKETNRQLKIARDEALAAAAEAKKEAERLKKEAAKKEKRSGVNAQCLESYKSFSIGSEGRSSWKSWMPHTKASGGSIFCHSSDQYALQQRAATGKYGIRTVDGRYCIAVGSAYANKIGTKIDVVMQSGRILNCILGDQKADRDTDAGNRYHVSDGSYVEFVVDRNAIDSRAKNAGNFDAIDEFSGPIAEIRVER